MATPIPPNAWQEAGRQFQGLGNWLFRREDRERARERQDLTTEMQKRRLELAEGAAQRAEDAGDRDAAQQYFQAIQSGFVPSRTTPATPFTDDPVTGAPRIEDTEIDLPTPGIGMAADRGAAEGAPGFAGALARRLGGMEPVASPEAVPPTDGEPGTFTGALRRRLTAGTAPETAVPETEPVRFTEPGFDPLRSADFRQRAELERRRAERREDEREDAADPALTEFRRLRNQQLRQGMAETEAERLARSIFEGDPEQTPAQVGRILDREVEGLGVGAGLGIAERVHGTAGGGGADSARLQRITELVPPVTPQQELAAQQLASGMTTEQIMEQAREAGLSSDMIRDVENYLRTVRREQR